MIWVSFGDLPLAYQGGAVLRILFFRVIRAASKFETMRKMFIGIRYSALMSCRAGTEVRELLLDSRRNLDRVANVESDEFPRLAHQQRNAFELWRLHVERCLECSSKETVTILRNEMRGTNDFPLGSAMKVVYP